MIVASFFTYEAIGKEAKIETKLVEVREENGEQDIVVCAWLR